MPPQPEEKREGKDNGDIEAVRITVTSKWNANIQREKGGEREREREHNCTTDSKDTYYTVCFYASQRKRGPYECKEEKERK